MKVASGHFLRIKLYGWIGYRLFGRADIGQDKSIIWNAKVVKTEKYFQKINFMHSSSINIYYDFWV